MANEPQSPRWKRRKDARPAEIVEAALAVFAKHGFAATRLEDVAKRAGISKGTLYLYFHNKEDLFKAVIRQTLITRIAFAESQVGEDTGTMREVLSAALTNMVGAIASNDLGVIPKLVLAEAGNFPDLARFYVEEVIARGLKLLTTIIARGVATGEFRDLDPALSAPIMVAPVLLFALWKNAFEPHANWRFDAASYFDTYRDLMLNGLLSAPPASATEMETDRA